jgi:deoxyribonuclease-1-like protein
MDRRAILAIILIGSAVAIYAFTLQPLPEPDSEPETITIAAFNIQIFGRAKRQNDQVMDILAEIAREFDVILVQEIRDSSEETAPAYLERINGKPGPDYAYVRSPRLGRTTSKEAYAYFYNTENVELIQGSDYVYEDTGDAFEREPYIASFRSGGFDFTLVGVHTKPDDAYNEIGNLTLVVHSILEMNPSEEDIIILGDLNADGSYYDEDDASNPLTRPEYRWTVSNEMDTMTKTDWTYDRMIMTDSTHAQEYVQGSTGVFYFDQEYGISDEELVWDVSDHYPIHAEFDTSLADND